MRFRFVHAADIHLGYEQYNQPDRLKDFYAAYCAVADYAIEHRADFVLIAGDLFHRAAADAWMLKQATRNLQRLRSAGIPVLAVEGNHDKQNTQKNLSWMQYLSDEELLVLLDVDPSRNGLFTFSPFDSSRRGGYLDIGDARIYGVAYHGAATSRILEEVADAIEPGPFTILMLHTGMAGQVPHMHGGLTAGQLEPLRGRVDYIALGHIHKRLIDGWVFNPGSTETNSMEEMEWPHGFFDVTVDSEATERIAVKDVDTPTLRPFRRISVGAEGCDTVDAFVDEVERRVAGAPDIPPGAVIELRLGGTAGFRRQDVPFERLKGSVDVRFSPLVTRVHNALVPPGTLALDNREGRPRAEVERQVVEGLVRQLAGYRDAPGEWTSLVLDVKNMAAEGDQPAAIADRIRDALRTLASGDRPSDTAEPASPAVPVVSASDAVLPEAQAAPVQREVVSPEPEGAAAEEFEDW